MANYTFNDTVRIDAGGASLPGDLLVPDGAKGLVIFSHGSGSSRKSTRNRAVATYLHDAGFATLLFDLLTPEEDLVYENRFNIPLITTRLIDTAHWIKKNPAVKHLAIGFFGASTGAASALGAAANLGDEIKAVVSRGGRPDLTVDALAKVGSPTLLIVGGNDGIVIDLNKEAQEELRCENKLEIVAGATHLFEEPGALEKVAFLAADWFRKYLASDKRQHAA
jgi:putative phosphoribosyl transferase